MNDWCSCSMKNDEDRYFISTAACCSSPALYSQLLFSLSLCVCVCQDCKRFAQFLTGARYDEICSPLHRVGIGGGGLQALEANWCSNSTPPCAHGGNWANKRRAHRGCVYQNTQGKYCGYQIRYLVNSSFLLLLLLLLWLASHFSSHFGSIRSKVAMPWKTLSLPLSSAKTLLLYVV